MSLAAMLQGSLPVRAPEHVPGSSSHALAAIDEGDGGGAGLGRPQVGSLYGEFEHEAFLEEDGADEPDDAAASATIEPGAGRQSVLEATVQQQVDRLQEWEEQLQAYSDSLTERGWAEWKKGQVTSIMQQLRRTVVPDVWVAEVERAEAEATAAKERVERAAQREAALLKKIETLENGPGCARELRERVEALELQLSQQQAREKQQSVFRQLLSGGIVSNNAGGGAPALRRRATTAALPGKDTAGSSDDTTKPPLRKAAKSAPIAVNFAGQPQPPAAGEAGEAVETARAAADADGAHEDANAPMSEEVEILQVQLARTQKEVQEANDEMDATRKANEERCDTLEKALEQEKKQHRHAIDALESQHVVAGVHEAQEMVQLRLELVAATEELEFLRAREQKVHDEENRLQMVSEMSKRLGTNVSRFELESLRSRVASLQEEAERVQKHNQELQMEAKQAIFDASALERLKGEITAFQSANDELEAEVRKRDAHMKSLEGQVHAANARIELLQRQLVLSHANHQRILQHHHQQLSAGEGGGGAGLRRLGSATDVDGDSFRESGRSLAASPDAPPPPLPGSEENSAQDGGGGGTRRKLPLLWDGSPGEGAVPGLGRSRGGGGADGDRDRDGLVSRQPLVPVQHRDPPPASRQASQQQLLAPGSPTRGDGVLRGGPHPRGGLTQRAVALHDEVASQPIAVERLDPAEPRVANAFPLDACRSVRVEDNRAELAAAAAWREAEAAHGVHLTRALKRQADGASQELQVVKANIASQVLHARVARLGTTRHYMMIAMMRALCKWALLLELDDAYLAALRQAASLIEEKAGGMAEELEGAAQRTVKALLVQPEMLGELSDLRRKLQAASSNTEALRGGLRKIAQRQQAKVLSEAATAGVLASTGFLPLEAGNAALRQRFLPTAPAIAAAAAGPPVALGVEPEAVKRSQELHKMQQRRFNEALRLKLRLVIHQWRASRERYDKQAILVRQITAQRNEELDAAARQAEALRRLTLDHHELLVERETWRKQSEEQADAIAAAISNAAAGTLQHEDEVFLLSEKLRQVIEEKEGLQALVDSQSTDLKIMSSEMIRMLGS